MVTGKAKINIANQRGIQILAIESVNLQLTSAHSKGQGNAYLPEYLLETVIGLSNVKISIKYEDTVGSSIVIFTFDLDPF